MDLSAGEYLASVEYDTLPPQSMKALSRRPNRAMMEEARYTEGHLGRTMKEPLRNKPLVFVKSAEVYDPRKLTVESLLKKDPLQIAEEFELLRMADTELSASPANENVMEDLAEEAAELSSEATSEESEAPAESSESNKESDGETEVEIEARSSEEEHDVEMHDSESGDESTSSDGDDTDDAEDQEPSFVIDDNGDENLAAVYGAPKASTSAVIEEARLKALKVALEILGSDEEIAYPESHLEYEPYLSVGKVMLRTEVDEDGSLVAEMPQGRAPRNGTGFKDLDSDYFEEESDSDEDAAFEDYLAQIMGANGEYDYDGENDSENDNEEYEYNIQLGDDDVSDVQISDDEGLEGDDDGLDDILSFARSQQRSFADFEVPPTKTLRPKGRTKKLKLDIEADIDDELRASLLEQFQYQKTSRRDKKLRKKERLRAEALESNDLMVKYDYSLHIKDIKGEFEDFLHDAERETLSFPPLDPHGNKTVSKLAGHYNMKCTRCGNGRHIFMKISKSRKTFHYLPDYNLINYVMKQRPIFKRSDVKKRTREEIEESDEKSSSRRGPKNGAFFKEGDIVGAEAPEIAQNNIGRRLLEKLGWVKGEGLGAQGNKGISVPLMATVKKSKTGLK